VATVSAVDVVIVGSSPNALAAAARLARAGRRVIVVEPTSEIGGPVCSTEFARGFTANIGMSAAPLDAEVATTLGIELQSELVRRTTVTRLAANPVTLHELALPSAFAHAIELVRAIDRVAPPALTATDELAAIGRQLLGLGEREMHEVLRLVFISVRDFCVEAKLSDAEAAVLAGIATRGRAAGPFAPGTLFGALRLTALDDAVQRWSVRGGVCRIPIALYDAAQSAGAVFFVRAGFPTIEIDGGVVTGVRLASGEKIDAPIVASDLDARATFTKLISPSELEPELKRTLRTLRYRGTVARIQLAVRELPRFTVEGEALRGTLVVAGSLAELESNWDAAKRGALPERPYLELAIPTLDDPSLAPPGQHVIDLWVQHVPPGTTDRDAVLARVLDTLAPHAPGLVDQILHHHVALPRDLEARFGLTEGHLYGGELSLEQSFLFRPFAGCQGYETPIRGVYLCGSAAHPGGYSGRSGWNFAGALLEHAQHV
jgi:phytoene dehydrogenase-like protein